MPAENSLPLKEIAEEFSSYPSLITSNWAMNYATYLRMIGTVANKLASLGIGKGDRITIVSSNCREYPFLLWASWSLCATVVPINPRFPFQQIYALRDFVGSRHLIVSKESAQLYKVQDKEILILENLVDLSKTESQQNFYWQNIPFDQPATIIFTSGSSGSPKAVLHSFGNHYFSALGSNLNIPIQPGDLGLLSLPLYHVGGLAILMRCFLAGGAMVIPEPDMRLEEALERFQITHLSLVSTQLYRLMQTEQGRAALRNLKVILLGGSAIPASLIKQSIDLGLPIHTSYGSTEMASQITTTPPNPVPEKLFTSGKLLKYRELKIAEDGAIWVRGKTLCRGYWEGDSLKPALNSDGWFHSGDIGKLDHQGYLTILGRKDNMFISGGENIQPEEIEQQLCQREGIKQAVVVPVKNKEFGYRPVAFIAMNQDKSLDEAEIRQYLAEHFPRFKIPDYFLPWPKEVKHGGIKPNRQYLKALANKL